MATIGDVKVCQISLSQEQLSTSRFSHSDALLWQLRVLFVTGRFIVLYYLYKWLLGTNYYFLYKETDASGRGGSSLSGGQAWWYVCLYKHIALNLS